MHWNITAPFFDERDPRWIDDFVPGDRHSFQKIIPECPTHDQWHHRRGRTTPIVVWKRHWRTAGKALAEADGVVTVFPQLAAAVSARRGLRRQYDCPIVAWCFNLGLLTPGLKQTAAVLALKRVERFVVHSKGEVKLVSNYLGIREERVRFVPLQRAVIPIEVTEEEDQPFLLSMGSANRDYVTLVRAARKSKIPVVIVAAPRALADLDLPANITHLSGLSPRECHLLAQRARASIVPLADVAAASGQITVIEAQRMQRPVIATRSIGTLDYIEHNQNGLLVEQGDADQLSDAMQYLWDDRTERTRLAEAGAAFASAHLSDETAGRALGSILDEIEMERK